MIYPSEILLNSEVETADFARFFAQGLVIGDIVTLTGDLGAGKTFICREIIRHFCGDLLQVQSPTFNILKTYEASNFIIYHFDLYRLKHVHEVQELGLNDAFSNLCLIEWPELLMGTLPKSIIKLHIRILDGHTRILYTS